MHFLFFYLEVFHIMPKLERDFQSELITEIKERLPGCIVTKINTRQGLPDLLVLYKDRWAMLECKRTGSANRQPNQDYYVDLLDRMSFSRFIYPENKSEVLDELCETFKSAGAARLSGRE